MNNFQPLYTAGFYHGEFSESELAPVTNEIVNIQSNINSAVPNNNNLAGNIEREYVITPDCIMEQLYPHIVNYGIQMGSFEKDNIPEFKENGTWVNFQKKYEFNPIHSHEGKFSFVIWIKVPFLMEDELSLNNVKYSNSPQAGMFNFHYTDILGNIKTTCLPIDKTMENHFIIFPSKLSHSVNAFYTSDEYRISIAGNVIF
jgi:hypothetical protein